MSVLTLSVIMKRCNADYWVCYSLINYAEFLFYWYPNAKCHYSECNKTVC